MAAPGEVTRGAQRRAARALLYSGVERGGLGSDLAALHAARKAHSGPNAATSSTLCQKCLQYGHWTYACKNERTYVHRAPRVSSAPVVHQSVLPPPDADAPAYKSAIHADRRREPRPPIQSQTALAKADAAVAAERGRDKPAEGKDGKASRSSKHHGKDKHDDGAQLKPKDSKAVAGHKRRRSRSSSTSSSYSSRSTSSSRSSRSGSSYTSYTGSSYSGSSYTSYTGSSYSGSSYSGSRSSYSSYTRSSSSSPSPRRKDKRKHSASRSPEARHKSRRSRSPPKSATKTKSRRHSRSASPSPSAGATTRHAPHSGTVPSAIDIPTPAEGAAAPKPDSSTHGGWGGEERRGEERRGEGRQREERRQTHAPSPKRQRTETK